MGCWLCCAGWAGLLGRDGDAGKAELAGAGQVRLAGFAFILSPFCLVVVVSFVFLHLFMLFLTLCSSFGLLWGSPFAPF